MRKTAYSLAGMTVLAATAALAAEAVMLAPVSVSSGYFHAADCTPEADPKSANECICKADVRKAQVLGVSEAAAAVINNQLAQVPEQLASESCSGKVVTAPAKEISVNTVSANYSLVYQSPAVLSVLVTYTTFGAGAAHESTGSEGYTFDLSTGKTILPNALLSAENLAKANLFVQKELLKKYGDVMLDEAKARTEPYLNDGGCENCTLYYNKDGWNLRFQLYSVAPYSAGEPVVVIPADIIPAPETLLTRK